MVSELQLIGLNRGCMQTALTPASRSAALRMPADEFELRPQG